MEVALRLVLIVYSSAAALAIAFSAGQERPEVDLRSTLKATLVVYALMSAGVIVWWPTPDLWSAIGKYTVLAMFVLDVVGISLSIKYPRGPVLGHVQASVMIVGALMVLVSVVFLWP